MIAASRTDRRPLGIYRRKQDLTETSDAKLIAGSLSNPANFDELFRRHARAVVSYLSAYVEPHMADQITAQTFADAFAGRQRFRPQTPTARPWLIGIARNHLYRHFRSTARHRRAVGRLPSAAPPAGDEIDIAVRLDATALGPELRDALAEIPAADRETLLLLAWHDLSYAEIAATLDIPIGTVRSRINRARKRLQALLDLPDDADG